jgi:anti-anti-sigma factor
MHLRPMACAFDAGTSTLYVSGVADEAEADRLRHAIGTASEDYTRDLTIDLTDCDFLPSISIGVIAGAMHEATAQGSQIDLVVAPCSIAARVLAIVGLPHRVERPSPI